MTFSSNHPDLCIPVGALAGASVEQVAWVRLCKGLQQPPLQFFILNLLPYNAAVHLLLLLRIPFVCTANSLTSKRAGSHQTVDPMDTIARSVL